jgi:hypothetical protein
VDACPTQALGYVPPGGEEGGQVPGANKLETLTPADELPGFSDPATARPGFWVVKPGGAIRSAWFERLRVLLEGGEEGRHV